MKFALRELVRRPGRFVTATVILTLIAVLLMFLGGLLDGLIRSSTGAIRAQTADAIVFSETSRASFIRSRIDPDVRAAIEAADGVDEVGGLGVVLLGARVPGNAPRDLANVALWGYELAPAGVPAPPAPGEAYADELLQADGVKVGHELLIGPARTPITVIGWVSDTAYNGQGGLWTELDTWRDVLSANRPDAVLADGTVQALAISGPDGAADAIAAADAAADGRAYALTIDEAINAIPGIEAQRNTFNQILGVTVVIAMVVIALFFALLTVERIGMYGVLKALGARSSTLFGGVVLQAVAVTAAAALLGVVVAVALDLAIPAGSIPYELSPARVLGSVASLLVAAVIGSAFSLRRVLRIDPASAIGGTT